jgi:hypothetical protein
VEAEPPPNQEVFMSIKKPLGLSFLIGLMAMAFIALPAMANAAPELTNPNKTTVAVGTTITATSTNATTKFSNGKVLTCKKIAVHGIVERNSNGEVEVVMEKESVDTASECTLSGESVSVGVTFTKLILTAAIQTASFDFSSGGLTEGCDCNVTYSPPATTIHIAGSVTGTVAGTFSGDFTLETASGAVITVD